MNWQGINREEYPTLSAFLDKATHRNPEQRFALPADAVAALYPRRVTEAVTDIAPQENFVDMPATTDGIGASETLLREERVDWLLSLLQSYPGSRWGNRETRGLDTDFAAETYVETNLEETLYRDIKERRVRLVVLCGNAGDGKTALLQHLANRLGLGRHSSSVRILEGQVSGDPIVRMNLDGSAAWRGRSADEILDEFLEPFQDGPPIEDVVHLLAINDGRLLEWIEGVESRRGSGETPLTNELY